MITQTEIENLVALNGHCGYNETTKAHFRKLSMKLLRELNTRLDTKGTVSFNAGGIAVSGDASLHSDSLHLFFNADGCGLGICGRTCKGKSDYQGGPNRWYSFERLKRDGMNGLFEWARGVQAAPESRPIRTGLFRGVPGGVGLALGRFSPASPP